MRAITIGYSNIMLTTTVGRIDSVSLGGGVIVGSNGMDAPTRSGINVPKWKFRSNHLTEGSAHHEDYDSWHRSAALLQKSGCFAVTFIPRRHQTARTLAGRHRKMEIRARSRKVASRIQTVR